MEYIIMRSKYKKNRHYINVLTATPFKGGKVLYRHYHEGNFMWSEEASDKLFKDVSDGSFYDIFEQEEQERLYPIYKRYSDMCAKL